MTKEEAVEVLKRLVAYDSDVAEAKQVAIEALSADAPSGDLIRREDAIDALGEEPDIWSDTEEEWAYRNAWVEHISAISALPSADRPTGECRTCGRNADNGGVHEDGRTKCPIQEHYALLLDGYCHLYEPYDCGAKMKGGDDE